MRPSVAAPRSARARRSIWRSLARTFTDGPSRGQELPAHFIFGDRAATGIQKDNQLKLFFPEQKPQMFAFG
jgi:hypothetical protein